MLRSTYAHLAAVLALALTSAASLAQPLGVNLVANGDAETGDVTGWLDGGAEAVASSVAGTLGLPPGTDLGAFCFTGGLGSETETITQIIDVSGRADQIDAGELTAAFAILVQSRRVTGAYDRGLALLQYRDGVGAVLASAQFEDVAVVDVHDWTPFEDERVVPPGTRTVWVRLAASRTTGASADAFFDNASLVLSAPCPADLDGDGALTIFDFLAFQNLFDAGDPAADFDGDGALTIFDFLAFQNAFDAGCE